MSDLSPAERLAKLRALEEWLDWQLRDTRRKIAQTEQQIHDQAGYISEQAITEGHPLGATIHRANCTRIERPVTTLTADQARAALTNDATFFGSCKTCDPRNTLDIKGAKPR